MVSRYFYGINTFIFVMFVLSFSLSTQANESDAKVFIERLKAHYSKEANISVFSLTHRYLGRSNAYQSWDYLAPSRYKALKVTDIDLVNKQYAQNVMHWFTGGQFVDEVHFQNSIESLRYERNGVYFGKGAVKQSLNSFERYKNLTLMNVDFLAIRPLLREQSIDENISITTDVETDETIVIHQLPKNTVMEYTFRNSTLRLSLINNKKRKRVYQYNDYTTQNGLTFARSVNKFYNGDKSPSFITVNEKFEVIEHIEQEKLILPHGYRKLESEHDKKFSLEKISAAHYVISNGSTNRNTLLKVNDKDIWVLGVPSNVRVAKQLLAFISDQFPNRAVSSVFVTHPYSDHIGGLPAFAELNINIYADPYTAKAISDYPRFSGVIDSFRINLLKHGQTINDITFYILENSRAKRQSFAYIKSEGLIYQSDFLEIAEDNTIPNVLPSYSKAFINFIRHENLTFRRIIGNHRNSNITPSILENASNGQSM